MSNEEWYRLSTTHWQAIINRYLIFFIKWLTKLNYLILTMVPKARQSRGTVELYVSDPDASLRTS